MWCPVIDVHADISPWQPRQSVINISAKGVLKHCVSASMSILVSHPFLLIVLSSRAILGVNATLSMLPTRKILNICHFRCHLRDTVYRSFYPVWSHSHSVPRKHTDVYINHKLVGLLAQASY